MVTGFAGVGSRRRLWAADRPLRRGQRGIALIELAIAGTVLVLLSLVVIADFGRIFMLGEQLTAAAEAGGLYAYQTWSFGDGTLVSGGSRERDIKLAVINGATGSGNNALSMNDISVVKVCNVCPIDPSDGVARFPINSPGGSCNGADCTCAIIDSTNSDETCEGYGPVPISFHITVEKDFYPITPGLRQIIGNPRRLTRTASYRVR